MEKVVQSVIINNNKNFAQNKPYNTLVPVAGELSIGANAEVAVYGGSLSRAPIVIRANKNLQTIAGAAYVGDSENRVELTLDFINSYPNKYQTLQDKILNSAFGAPLQQIDQVGAVDSIKIEIPEGNYTRDNFCNTLSQLANNFIENDINEISLVSSTTNTDFEIGTADVLNEVPYYLDYAETDSEFFMGLRNTKLKAEEILNGPVNQQLFQQRNNTESQYVGVDLVLDSIGSPITHAIYSANATVQAENWNSFLRSDQALIPMLMENASSGDGNYQGEGTFYSFGINMSIEPGTITTSKKQICVGFTNTLYQSEWTATGVPETQTLAVNDVGPVPNLYLSANFVQVYEQEGGGATYISQSYIDIMMADTLNEGGATFNYLSNAGTAGAPFAGLGAIVRLSRIQMPYDLPSDSSDEQPTLTGRYEWRFYAEDYKINNNVFEQGSTIYTKAPRIYYFQLISENGPDRQILYDSKVNGVYINANWLDDGTLFQCVKSARDATEGVSTGFMPIVLFNNTVPADVFFSPQGNFILYQKTNGDFVARQRIGEYTFKTNNTDLANTLGTPLGDTLNNPFDLVIDGTEIERNLPAGNVYNPNAYPVSKTQGGLTNLFSDFNRYNIELNLPIKAFNSTESNVNNIGQKRNIIYNQDPFVQGETTLLASSNIVRNIEPNSLKYLTLNNSAPLNINNLRLQIRRAKTNELATEITDSQIEILIKSDRN
tara:strand:+ start:3279 stop:5432 length:2154 start_codon:yes stop_codon:yes gene_type:complete